MCKLLNNGFMLSIAIKVGTLSPVQQLQGEAGILENVASESQASDMRYRVVRRLIIFMHKEFGPVNFC